jgi:hypothetical protein
MNGYLWNIAKYVIKCCRLFNASKIMDKAKTITQELKSKTDNLSFSSESDHPFTIIQWDGKEQNLSLDNESLFRNTKHSPELPVVIVKLEDLFHRAIQEEEWHGETEKNNVLKFKELMTYLQENFKEIKIFKVGEFEIDTYILGMIDSDVVGLHTKIIQT